MGGREALVRRMAHERTVLVDSASLFHVSLLRGREELDTLNRLMVVLAHPDGKMLMDNLANEAPARAIVHGEQVTTVGDELVGDMQRRTGGSRSATSVEKLFNLGGARQDDHRSRSELQAHDGPVSVRLMRQRKNQGRAERRTACSIPRACDAYFE